MLLVSLQCRPLFRLFPTSRRERARRVCPCTVLPLFFSCSWLIGTEGEQTGWGWGNTKSSLYCQNAGSRLWILGLALSTPSHCGLPHGLSLVADLFHATPICPGLAPWGTLLARLIFRHYGSVLDISLFAGVHPHCLVLLA